VLLIFATAFAAYPRPQAKYYAAIDLGSKGTKAVLYRFERGIEGIEARSVFRKTINTKLVSSMKGPRFTSEGIQDATEAAKELVKDMRTEADKIGLSDVQYYIVGSSGVAKGENKADLVAAVKEATGIAMDFVDAKQEGYFTLISSVPLMRRQVAVVIDVGSGNTKAGCLVGDTTIQNFKSAEISYGSVSGRNAAFQKNKEDYKAGVKQVMADEVKPAYERESLDAPCLRNRARLFWSGGAAWATATFRHPENARDGYVALTRADLESFLSSLANGTWNQEDLQFHFTKDVPAADRQSIRKSAEEERGKVFNVFAAEDLLSGVSIMKTVLESSNQSPVIFFVRDGNYIYGYALDKFNAEHSLETPPATPKKAKKNT